MAFTGAAEMKDDRDRCDEDQSLQYCKDHPDSARVVINGAHAEDEQHRGGRS